MSVIMSQKIKIIRVIIPIVICLFAGFIGSFFTTTAIPTWYASINKPSFNPPNWLFGPVWTFLYILMGISLYIIWDKDVKNKKIKNNALMIFGIQLFLNVLWSVIFFGLKSPFYAFIEIMFLWVTILFTIISFYKISKTASFLLIPYILWVSFASLLNFYVWVLN